MNDDLKLRPWRKVQEFDEIKNRWIGVRNVTYELPNGRIMKDYYVVDKPDSVVIVPVRNKQTFLMREYERAAE